MKYVGNKLLITVDDFECIEQGWRVELGVDEEFDWKYKEISENRLRGITQHVFVFTYDEKWWRGVLDVIDNEGWDKKDILCEQVEPYEKTIISYRKVRASTGA